MSLEGPSNKLLNLLARCFIILGNGYSYVSFSGRSDLLSCSCVLEW